MPNLKDLMDFHNARLYHELANRPMSLVVIESIFVAAIALAAFTGNILVCTAIVRNRRLHSPTYVLIFALALTDIAMSVVSMPLTTGVLVFGGWVYDKRTCEFQAKFPLTVNVTPLQLMVVVSLNRYLCVTKPSLYRKLFTMKKTIAYATAVFFLSLAYILIPMFYAGVSYDFSPGKSLCVFTAESNFSFSLIMGLMFIALPFVVMSCLYCRICIAVRSANRVFPQSNAAHDNQLTAHVQEMKVTKTLGAVLIGFCCCWFPVMVIDQIDMTNGEPLLPRQVYLFYVVCVYMSSAINPVLYAFISRAFRAQFKIIITCK